MGNSQDEISAKLASLTAQHNRQGDEGQGANKRDPENAPRADLVDALSVLDSEMQNIPGKASDDKLELGALKAQMDVNSIEAEAMGLPLDQDIERIAYAIEEIIVTNTMRQEDFVNNPIPMEEAHKTVMKDMNRGVVEQLNEKFPMQVRKTPSGSEIQTKIHFAVMPIQVAQALVRYVVAQRNK